jgi:hypothetical protein
MFRASNVSLASSYPIYKVHVEILLFRIFLGGRLSGPWRTGLSGPLTATCTLFAELLLSLLRFLGSFL